MNEKCKKVYTRRWLCLAMLLILLLAQFTLGTGCALGTCDACKAIFSEKHQEYDCDVHCINNPGNTEDSGAHEKCVFCGGCMTEGEHGEGICVSAPEPILAPEHTPTPEPTPASTPAPTPTPAPMPEPESEPELGSPALLCPSCGELTEQPHLLSCGEHYSCNLYHLNSETPLSAHDNCPECGQPLCNGRAHSKCLCGQRQCNGKLHGPGYCYSYHPSYSANIAACPYCALPISDLGLHSDMCANIDKWPDDIYETGKAGGWVLVDDEWVWKGP